MDTFINLLGGCMDFINDIATNISETLTGASSGAVLIMFVFYLSILIISILLLRLLIVAVKSLFRLFLPSSKKKGKGQKGAGVAPVTANIAGISQETLEKAKLLTAIEDFEENPLLDSLSLEFNKFNEVGADLFGYEEISEEVPEADLIEVEENVELSADDKGFATRQVEGREIVDLKSLLVTANSEKIRIDQSIAALKSNLAELRSKREGIAKEERSVIDKHNVAVDSLKGLADEFENVKTDVCAEYSELTQHISGIHDRRSLLFTTLSGLKEDVSSVSGKVDSFASACQEKTAVFVEEFKVKENLTTGLKNSYMIASKNRAKTDDKISDTITKLAEAVKRRAVNNELLRVAGDKLVELEKLEAERIAREEAERLARLEAEKAERERLAKLEAERVAKERAEELIREKEAEMRRAREAAASTVTDSALEKVSEQVKQHSENAYAMNFDNISPEMLAKMAVASQKSKLAAEKAGLVSGVNGEVAEGTDSEALNVEGSSEGASEEAEVDYLAELKKTWAEEAAHKEAWEAEQEQKRQEAARRKAELSKKLASDNTNNENEE